MIYCSDAIGGAQHSNAELAMKMACAGVAIFPCLERPDGEHKTKSPYTSRGFKDASNDIERVRAWWRLYPGALIGIVPGQHGVHALVLDLDRKPGRADGVAAYRALVPDYDDDEFGIVARTPGGGEHVWLRRPKDGHGNSRGALPAGIDVRCDAGYVCIGIMADGSRYESATLVQALVDGWEWPEIPITVVALLKRPAASVNTPIRATTRHFAPCAAVVRSALHALPLSAAETYDTWLAHGMSLHEWASGAGAGLVLWENWSEQAANFGQCAEKWRSFGKSPDVGTRTVASIIHAAQATGWSLEAAEVEAAQDSTRQLASRIEAPRTQTPFDIHAELTRMAEADLKRSDPVAWAEQIDLLHSNAATHNGGCVGVTALKDGYKRAREIVKKMENKAARDSDDALTHKGALAIVDFLYLPTRDRYIHVPSGGYWTATGVNSAVHGDDPAETLRETRRVDGVVWDPTLPRIVPEMTLVDEYVMPCDGSVLFNRYSPARIEAGDASGAEPWVRHLRTLYPNEADELIDAAAFFVQHPGDKINWMLVLLGSPGIGKDWILQPILYAAGKHNVKTVAPKDIMSDFDEYKRCRVLVVNELSDLGKSHSKYAFHEQLKPLCTSPPEFFTVNGKYQEKTVARNVLWTIGMSNNRERAMYVPADDRRTFVCGTDVTRLDLETTGVKWDTMYAWMRDRGARDVVAFLRGVDASAFCPGDAPRKTAAWHELTEFNKPIEQMLTEDHQDIYGAWPIIINVQWILQQPNMPEYVKMFFSEDKNRNKFREKLRAMGYEHVHNPSNKMGKWSVKNVKTTLYVRSETVKHDRVRLANAWCAARR